MINQKLHLSEDVFNANIKLSSTRQGFGDALLALAEKNEAIVVLTGDLKESLRVDKFAEKYPKRFIEVGVAEQNMTGIGTGLALAGKIPYVTSYAASNPGRNWEQIRTSICYGNANVKLVGGHVGFSADRHGVTHQAFEDIALARVLPNMTILYPADYAQTKKVVKEAAELNGPVYIRLNRNESPMFTTHYTPFKIGEAQILKGGKDITIAVTGPLCYEVLLAARELDLKYRISAEVINFHTIKPLDEQTLLKSIKKTGVAVTVEEHQIIGGLGSAVAETICEKHPSPVHRMGLADVFGESGTREELLEKYNLTRENIIDKVKSLLITKK